MSVRPPRASKKPQPTRSAPMTRRQLSRHQREVRQQRIALIMVAVAVVVALLVPAYGYWRQTYGIGGDAIAVVNGKPISTELYARFLGFQEQLITHDAKRLSDQAAQATDDAAKQALQEQQSSLQTVAQSLQSDSLEFLIEQPLVAAEAEKRGITASQAEIDKALQQVMSAYPKYGIRYESLTSVPDDKLVSLDQAKTDLDALVGGGQFLSQAQVNDLFLTQLVLRGKLLAQLSADVPTSGPQVHARHILVATEAEAQAARERIVSGEDFATVAKDVSTDTSTKEKGGDLGWFAHDQMVKEFADAAFALQVNETSEPVQTSYGWHIIQVLGKEDDRPYEQSYVDQLKATKLSDWVSSQESAAGAVERLDSQDKLTWADNFISSRMPATQ